jgi:DNA-binding NarL/FixJ family response regulator
VPPGNGSLPEETVSGAYETTRLNTKRHAKLTERRENIADLLAQRLKNGTISKELSHRKRRKSRKIRG